jgi:hypothetical protein
MRLGEYLGLFSDVFDHVAADNRGARFRSKRQALSTPAHQGNVAVPDLLQSLPSE